MAQLSHAHDHERTDAKVKPLVIFLVLMAGMVFFAFVVTSVLFEFFEQRLESTTAPAGPLQVMDEEPPGPQLQVVPGLDRRAMDAEDRQRLEEWGWVDEGAGVARIPVEKAMDALLEKGLPARASEPAAVESAP